MDVVRDYLPWLLSAITIWMTLLAGNMHRSAWLVGLAIQVLWLIWIVAICAWGLLPLNATLSVVYARNLWRWNTPKRARPGTDARGANATHEGADG